MTVLAKLSIFFSKFKCRIFWTDSSKHYKETFFFSSLLCWKLHCQSSHGCRMNASWVGLSDPCGSLPTQITVCMTEFSLKNKTNKSTNKQQQNNTEVSEVSSWFRMKNCQNFLHGKNSVLQAILQFDLLWFSFTDIVSYSWEVLADTFEQCTVYV